MTTPEITDAEMVRIVDRIAETRRELANAEDARERRPLPQWDVTVEYRAHQFFPDEPQFHIAYEISAPDGEAAVELAYAEVRALEGVTVREFVNVTVTRVETPAVNLDAARTLHASLSVGFPPRSAET